MLKNKWVSLLLCVFLGIFGAHKFYEGRILLGLLYLFTGGFACIGVYDDESRDHMFEMQNICDDFIYNLGKLLPGNGFNF